MVSLAFPYPGMPSHVRPSIVNMFPSDCFLEKGVHSIPVLQKTVCFLYIATPISGAEGQPQRYRFQLKCCQQGNASLFKAYPSRLRTDRCLQLNPKQFQVCQISTSHCILGVADCILAFLQIEICFEHHNISHRKRFIATSHLSKLSS